jgi:hypothetical protein
MNNMAESILLERTAGNRNSKNEWNLEILDTSPLSLMREDASFDCAHFFLPGVPDIWNLMLLNRFCNLGEVRNAPTLLEDEVDDQHPHPLLTNNPSRGLTTMRSRRTTPSRRTRVVK